MMMIQSGPFQGNSDWKGQAALILVFVGFVVLVFGVGFLGRHFKWWR